MDNNVFAPFLRAAERWFTSIYNVMERNSEEQKVKEFTGEFFRRLPTELHELILTQMPRDQILTCLSLNRSWKGMIEGSITFRPIVVTERAINIIKMNKDFIEEHHVWAQANMATVPEMNQIILRIILPQFLYDKKLKGDYEHILLDRLGKILADHFYVEQFDDMIKAVCRVPPPDQKIIKFFDPSCPFAGESTFAKKIKDILDQYNELVGICEMYADQGMRGEFVNNQIEEKITEIVERFLNKGYIGNALNISQYCYEREEHLGYVRPLIKIIQYFVKVGEINKAIKQAKHEYHLARWRGGIPGWFSKQRCLMKSLVDALVEKYHDNKLILSELRIINYIKMADLESLEEMVSILEAIDFTSSEESKVGADERNKSGTLANYWFTYGL